MSLRNLALANLFERRYRREKKPETLEASNQAIVRVLEGDRSSTKEHAEALALQGRNAKTLWRLEFETLPDVATRRKQATSRALLKSYESYRAAYLFDLNHFWSGLAGLQMAFIAQALSDGAEWEDLFDDEKDARDYKSELESQIGLLSASTRLAIQAALARLPKGDERMWAEISRADMMFLFEESAGRVVRAYVDAVPDNNLFAWKAATDQLTLFAGLGIKVELAERIISTLAAKVKQPPPEPDLSIVIFVGHRIDDAGRAEARFPAEREARARELIRGRLAPLAANGARLRVFASAAPGGDILCHEVCRELGTASIVCLPMPIDDFSRVAFGALDHWRARFLRLVDGGAVLQLSDREGLPNWLAGSSVSPWERGNQWVLEMARTGGARKVLLIALWDGNTKGDDAGGTGHMVTIARKAGTVEVDWIRPEEWMKA